MSSDFMLLRDKENYAVLVCTSRYWFNYRHFANTLSVYILIKKLGIPDRNIILMNANDALSDPRNPLVGRIYNIPDNLESNIIDDRFEVDYRGDEVNPDSFSRVLTGHHYHTTSPSKRLDLNNNSNILIYITGHGGNEFMKFHDYEEFSAQDFSYIIHEMHIKKRFNEILIISDTCQAETLTSLIKTPNIISISSAKVDENSYAFTSNNILGVAVIDRFTYLLYNYIQNNIIKNNSKKSKNLNKNKNLQELVDSMDPNFLSSTATLSRTPSSHHYKSNKITEFFSQILQIEFNNINKISNNFKIQNYFNYYNFINLFENISRYNITVLDDELNDQGSSSTTTQFMPNHERSSSILLTNKKLIYSFQSNNDMEYVHILIILIVLFYMSLIFVMRKLNFKL